MSRAFGRVSATIWMCVAMTGCANSSHEAPPQVAAVPPFVPDDPIYAPGPATRDGWGQWHLRNQVPVGIGNAGLDINVAPAWARGLTGRGVVVGVVDQAPHMDHPDLITNYRADLSYDFSKPNDGGVVRPSGAEHGTQCAGLIAARGGNGVGVIGVAPDANWAALAVALGVPRTQAAQAIAWRAGEIDVLNLSIGFPPREYLPQVIAAADAAASAGAILVKSAGNTRGGLTIDDCTAEGLVSHPAAIVVAAIGSDGRYSEYSQFGSAVACCAPSDVGSAERPTPRTKPTTKPATTTQTAAKAETQPAAPLRASLGGVLTTNGKTGYARFGGTSAAAPIVSGAMALVRQARQDAGGLRGEPADWSRYAKHLLARTCRVVDPDDRSPTSNVTADLNSGAGWIRNGAGVKFNANYGFGLIDVDALTRAAERYTGVTPAQSISVEERAVGLPIPDDDGRGVQTTFDLTGDRPLESVSVTLRIEHLVRPQVEVFLRSPAGTTSRLLMRGRGGDTPIFRVKWDPDEPIRLTSNAFWGERPEGRWTLVVRDVQPKDTGTWISFSVAASCGTLVED